MDPAIEAAVARAAEAEAFGREVPPDVEAFEQVAADRGADGVAAVLIARANRRWAAIYEQIALPGSFVLPRLARLASVDAGLAALRVEYRTDGTPGVSPAVYAGDWAHHVRWGADSVAGAARFLMLLQGVGAACLVRQALERWTRNRAFTLSLDEQEGESKGEFFARVWRGGTDLRLDIKKLYDETSELLHARGAFVPIVEWETADLAETEPPPEGVAGLAVLADLGTLVLQQVTACVMDLAHHAERPELIEPLMTWPRTSDPPGLPACDRVLPTLLPLSPGLLASDLTVRLAADAEIYERRLNDLLTTRDPPITMLAPLAFLHRRHRAVQAAIAAFEEEERLMGGPLDFASLVARESRYVLVCEAAAIAGRWTTGHARASLVVAASALRSAFLLWLEDDNRAMAAVRSVLQCVAQARTWRLKPEKAARLAERGVRASPRDWLQAAGWRRFGVLNVALGELAHANSDARWSGAIDALAAAQPSPAELVPPIRTARGSALGQVAYLLAAETLQQVARASPVLVEPFRQVLALGREPETVIDRWLDAASRFTRVDLGTPDFVPLTDDERLEHLRGYRRSGAQSSGPDG